MIHYDYYYQAILVEGDSDELIVQRAYMDSHRGKLPISDGIDIISVGISFGSWKLQKY